MNQNTTEESKYIQQHLANERTYLAWVRTAIAIIGIGFLATSLHFNTDLQSILNDRIAISISVFSIFIGLATLLLSTIIYFRNRKNINTQTFHSSFKLIIFMTIIIATVFLVFLLYFIA
ncbi:MULTISPECIES: YidH family protein [Bacillus]|uniref:YidH family protein n=1 Tax=Bacillus TaxID=1386 RepID=UPI000BB8FA09|nr:MULTISPECIES: DUF202 domain-containing protein [Bacillus]